MVVLSRQLDAVHLSYSPTRFSLCDYGCSNAASNTQYAAALNAMTQLTFQCDSVARHGHTVGATIGTARVNHSEW